MTPDLPDEDEDALAETLADRVVDLVNKSHPTASPKFRRQVARLYLKQFLCAEKPPGEISQRGAGKPFRIAHQRVSELEADVRLRVRSHPEVAALYLQLRERHPRLF